MSELLIDSQITFITTRDLARSARFYEDALGFPLARNQGACRIYRICGRRAYIGICQNVEAPEASAGLILTLATKDVDGWYERIMSR